jgi:two-component system invasion response regulator UvrY
MKRLRTLLVDDNKSFLVLSKHLLAPLEGIELVGFGHDGFDAVRLADELRPDLIIMDLVMPGMSGLQATRLIKAQDHPPRVIIVSHYDDAEHREHASQAGADGFVEKNSYESQIKALVKQLTEAQP